MSHTSSPHIGGHEFEDTGDAHSFATAGFHAANDPTAMQHTVSPQDLLLDSFDDSFSSAPNSNALTNLTTPSLFDGSPDDLDSTYDVSPMLDSSDVSNTHGWYPLFADADTDFTSTNVKKPTLETSLSTDSVTMVRTSSETSDRSPSVVHRLSLSSGVQKNKRTGKYLAPIEVDEADSKAVKRAKNTLAARKSRQKKRDVEDSLRIDLAAMTAERDRWMHIAISRGATPPTV